MNHIEEPKNLPHTFPFFEQIDLRGNLVKPFPFPVTLGFLGSIREVFVSTSRKGTIRGMHFNKNLSPDSWKVIVVLKGEIQDTVVDLTKNNFGDTYNYSLQGSKPEALFVPGHCAHGFQALTSDATVLYLTGYEFSAQNDGGFNSLTFGQAWTLDDFTQSKKDAVLPGLESLRGELYGL